MLVWVLTAARGTFDLGSVVHALPALLAPGELSELALKVGACRPGTSSVVHRG